MHLHGNDDPAEDFLQNWQAGADTPGNVTGKVIDQYREAMERVRVAELKILHKRLPKLDERSKLAVHQFADRLVAKMVEPPLDSLLEESDIASRNSLLNALQRLFQLKD